MQGDKYKAKVVTALQANTDSYKIRVFLKGEWEEVSSDEVETKLTRDGVYLTIPTPTVENLFEKVGKEE